MRTWVEVGGSLETEVQVVPESRLSSISIPFIGSVGATQLMSTWDSPGIEVATGAPSPKVAAVEKAASDLRKIPSSTLKSNESKNSR